MSVLSDSIEQFIKELMGAGEEISLQRNELAQHFSCAPSQINYVLSTRFTLEQGYIIVSKRGGGGYIRVQRVDTDRDKLLHEYACERVGASIGLREATGIIRRLYAHSLVSVREANMMLAAVGGVALPTQEMGDAVRARVLRAMLQALMQHKEEEE